MEKFLLLFVVAAFADPLKVVDHGSAPKKDNAGDEFDVAAISGSYRLQVCAQGLDIKLRRLSANGSDVSSISLKLNHIQEVDPSDKNKTIDELKVVSNSFSISNFMVDNDTATVDTLTVSLEGLLKTKKGEAHLELQVWFFPYAGSYQNVAGDTVEVAAGSAKFAFNLSDWEPVNLDDWLVISSDIKTKMNESGHDTHDAADQNDHFQLLDGETDRDISVDPKKNKDPPPPPKGGAPPVHDKNGQPLAKKPDNHKHDFGNDGSLLSESAYSLGGIIYETQGVVSKNGDKITWIFPVINETNWLFYDPVISADSTLSDDTTDPSSAAMLFPVLWATLIALFVF